MKKQSQFLMILAALFAMILSACGGTAATETETSAGSNKPLASLVEFTGVIDAINGNQWTIDGQVITIDPSVLRDGPFEVGDTVKVEAEVQADGTVVVTRVEPPIADVSANANDDNSNSELGNANGNDSSNANGNANSNSNSNSNDDNSNGNSNGNSNDDNSNADNSNGNSSDDNSNNDDNSGSGGNDNGDDSDDDSNGNGDDSDGDSNDND